MTAETRIDAIDTTINVLLSTRRRITENRVRHDIQAVAVVSAAEFSVPLDDVVGSSRARKYVIPRHVAMYLARKEGHRLEAIGKYFGRDHSSVIHAVQNVVNLMDTEDDFRERIEGIGGRMCRCRDGLFAESMRG